MRLKERPPLLHVGHLCWILQSKIFRRAEFLHVHSLYRGTLLHLHIRPRHIVYTRVLVRLATSGDDLAVDLELRHLDRGTLYGVPSVYSMVGWINSH